MSQALCEAERSPEAALGEERRHRIVRVEVAGGFLDGLTLELGAGLNCVIGGRGTGKTTVLEFLRWALKAPADAAQRADRRGLQRLVQGNLGEAGRIRVSVETREGLRYTIERRLSGQAEVFDERDRLTELTLARGAIFDVEVYSQNEIESIATDAKAQLALIDRVTGRPIRDVQEQILDVRTKIQANGRAILSLEEELRGLDAALTEHPVLLARLAAHKNQAPAVAGFDAAVAEKGLREREARVAAGVADQVAGQREAIGRAVSALAARADVPTPVRRGRNREAFAAIDTALATCQVEAGRLLAAAMAAVDACAGGVAAARRQLEQEHRGQEEAFLELARQNERERGRAHERLQLERRLQELTDRQRLRNERRDELAARRAERAALVARFSELRDERFELRRQVAERLSRDLTPKIRVTIQHARDRTAFRELLAQAFQGTGRHHALAAQVAQAFVPADLAAALGRPDPAAVIAERTGMPRSKAVVVVEQLEGDPRVVEAEGVDVEDVPVVELWDEDRYKVTDDLSTGQRCTAILPILLLESDAPLLIDQPEDNLDNAFIFETVVSLLRQVKARRQLLLVTHNPNVPVLGDAARVFVLRSTGGQAHVHAQGDVDDVREHVAAILEGGRAAFEARRHRYGY